MVRMMKIYTVLAKSSAREEATMASRSFRIAIKIGGIPGVDALIWAAMGAVVAEGVS